MARDPRVDHSIPLGVGRAGQLEDVAVELDAHLPVRAVADPRPHRPDERDERARVPRQLDDERAERDRLDRARVIGRRARDGGLDRVDVELEQLRAQALAEALQLVVVRVRARVERQLELCALVCQRVPPRLGRRRTRMLLRSRVVEKCGIRRRNPGPRVRVHLPRAMAATRQPETDETTYRRRAAARPEPDEAPLDDVDAASPPGDEGRGLPKRAWPGILFRAAKKTAADNMPMIAAALAYASFLAIPSILLVALGVFTLVAGPDTITNLMNHLGTFMPGQATSLLEDSLRRLEGRSSASLAMLVVGLVLAVWSITSAMTNYMTGVTIAYAREDRRGFVRKRLTALVLAAAIGLAFVLVSVLLILGPVIEHAVGSALGIEPVLRWAWWVAQVPILVVGLLAAFATLLWLGPDVERPRWRLVSAGSVVAALAWLATSVGFAIYTSKFGSYNKTWGSLAAVIIMLTWLWLTALSLLYGAEVNAEADRSRRSRQRATA
jgi:membrane protein